MPATNTSPPKSTATPVGLTVPMAGEAKASAHAVLALATWGVATTIARLEATFFPSKSALPWTVPTTATLPGG